MEWLGIFVSGCVVNVGFFGEMIVGQMVKTKIKFV